MSKAAELANLIGNINAGGGGVNRNVIINGAMNVAQRGTSSTGLGASSGYFTLDRFKMVCNNTAGRFTMTQDSSAPDGFANSLKLACTTADTSIAANEEFGILYRMEGQDLQHFKKGTSSAYPTTLSFYVKGNASATYVAELMDGDNSSRHIGATFNVTTDWTRVEITFPGDTTGTLDDDNAASLDLQFFLHAGSNNTSGTLQTSWGALAQTNRAVGISSFFDSTDRTFFLTGVQLEVGQNSTSFEHEKFSQSLEKCQRYHQVNDVGAEHFPTIRESDDLKRTTVHYLTRMRSNSPSLTLTTTTLDSAALSVDEARETGASIIMSSGSDGNTPKIHVYTVEDEL